MEIDFRETEPVLAVENLSVVRGETTILRRVSWSVSPGEHWAILGSNGSGKTSLLQALTGYLFASAGTVSLLGRKFGETDWRELRERVGLVSSAVRQKIPEEETALETVVSGKTATIAFWGKVGAADRAEAEKLLRRVRAAHLADREWRLLSQGERQRVLIARAMMADPALLILDEPCAGLDPVAREQFLYFLQQLAEAEEGPSLVLVTHHVEEIVPAISHALLLKKGRAVASGKKEQVLTSEALSKAFDADVRISRRNGRYRMTVEAKEGRRFL